MFDDDSRWVDARDRHDDARDIESRDREPVDPRDVFAHDLDLPRSDERDRVHDRDREYRLRNSETQRCRLSGLFELSPRASFFQRSAGVMPASSFRGGG